MLFTMTVRVRCISYIIYHGARTVHLIYYLPWCAYGASHILFTMVRVLCISYTIHLLQPAIVALRVPHAGASVPMPLQLPLLWPSYPSSCAILASEALIVPGPNPTTLTLPHYRYHPAVALSPTTLTLTLPLTLALPPYA